MLSKYYKPFKAHVMSDTPESDLWWCGYYFLDLTTRQNNEVYDILVERGFERDGEWVVMPSGIRIRRV